MNVIGHQAVAPDGELIPDSIIEEGLQECFAISILKEGRLAVLAALGDVLGHADGDNSRSSRRENQYSPPPKLSQKR